MQTILKNVKISAIATCVPEREMNIFDNKIIYGGNEKKLKKIVKVTGFQKRRVLKKGSSVTAGDLCQRAAEVIFEELKIDKNEISAMVLVTQYPDYFGPATSCVIHGKLGLSQCCAAFDVNQGCAGYVYGLWIAGKIVDENSRKVLLLVGDTASKLIGTGEDAVEDIPIFGDGGSATLLEYDKDAESMFFDIGVEGKNAHVICSHNGGFRNQPTKDMFCANGHFDYQNKMDGLAVVDFTLEKAPKTILDVINFANVSKDKIDFYLLHQANKMILDNIANAIGESDSSKIPCESLSKFGNLSCASIPGIIIDKRELFDKSDKKVVMSGFGVGLTWASLVVSLKDVNCLKLVEYKERL